MSSECRSETRQRIKLPSESKPWEKKYLSTLAVRCWRRLASAPPLPVLLGIAVAASSFQANPLPSAVCCTPFLKWILFTFYCCRYCCSRSLFHKRRSFDLAGWKVVIRTILVDLTSFENRDPENLKREKTLRICLYIFRSI